MAYSAGAATDIPDLMSKIETFIAANGWTIDEADSVSGWPGWHKLACYVQFRYDGTTPQANGRSMGVYQSTGFTGGTVRPGGNPGDSGCGANDQAGTIADSTIDNARCVYTIGDGPFNYWIFERDDGAPGVFYIHIVLEVRQGEYRHFGFGKIDRFGDWGGNAGGEYCYGHRMEGSFFTTDSQFGLDGGNGNTSTESTDSAASIILGGSYPGKEASDWAVIGSNKAKYTGSLDRANVQRSMVLGGMRIGPNPSATGIFTGFPGFTGVIPMTSIELFAVDYISSPKRTRYLGAWADVRWCSIANFDAAEEVVIGSDTWVFFPIQKKGTLGGIQGDSYYAGIAYRKDLT